MRRISLTVALLACAVGFLLIPTARLIDLTIGRRYYIMDMVLCIGLVVLFTSLFVIMCGYVLPWLRENLRRLFRLTPR